MASLLLLCQFWGLNSGPRAWTQASLPTEPPHKTSTTHNHASYIHFGFEDYDLQRAGASRKSKVWGKDQRSHQKEKKMENTFAL